MYYEYSELNRKIPNHRLLAVNRGVKENILTFKMEYDIAPIEQYANQLFQILSKKNQRQKDLLQKSLQESLKRFILPTLERDLHRRLTESAETDAIQVFGQDVEQLLLQSPLKNKVVMGFDPAYRTGCKLAIVDETGKLLAVDVIYPTPSPKQNIEQAENKFQQLVKQYNVNMIAIGNGTASRESEQFVSAQIKKLQKNDLYYTIVSEAGASVYSASELARAEFPDLQVEERSAVSIARRLQDPLAELVKIDPKAIGVGQYQHDVNQKQLGEQLDFIIEVAVNKVGVDLNTASPTLLTHISGLNKTIAQNIVNYRNENGRFKERKELQNVPRLGPKAFEQAAGFLKIPDGFNILDNTEIHPEMYAIVSKLLSDYQIVLNENGTLQNPKQLDDLQVEQIASKYQIGTETMHDIISSLRKPGRDIRENMAKPILRQDVLSIEDLQIGMELTGTVRNLVDFGAFVDIGVKQDGLVHISKISHEYLKHPSQVLAVGDIVTVYVEDIDIKKERISLTMLQKG